MAIRQGHPFLPVDVRGHDDRAAHRACTRDEGRSGCVAQDARPRRSCRCQRGGVTDPSATAHLTPPNSRAERPPADHPARTVPVHHCQAPPHSRRRAPSQAPLSLRAIYGSDIINNALHGSTSAATAFREIKYFFPKARRASICAACAHACVCCHWRPHRPTRGAATCCTLHAPPRLGGSPSPRPPRPALTAALPLGLCRRARARSRWR